MFVCNVYIYVVSFVRLTKPRFAESIERNYLKLAEEKTEKAVVEEKNRRLMAQKESDMSVAQKDNEISLQKAASQSEIALQSAASANRLMIMAMQAKQEEQEIKNAMTVSEARANALKSEMEAKALETFYSIPGFVEVKKAEAVSQNQKIYYGEKLPLVAYLGAGAGAAGSDHTGILRDVTGMK